MYIPRALADLSATDSGPNSLEDKLKWIVVAIVGSVLFIVATGVYLFINKSRARKYQAAQQKDPSLSRKEYTRIRKLSKAERVEEQETQRTIIIRKSLATKSPSASMSSLASRSSTIQSLDEEEEIDLNDNEPRGMKQDWKEFEARVKRDRTSSGEVHPISREPSPAPSWTVSSASQLQLHPSTNLKLQHFPSLSPQYSNPALAGHPAFRSESLTPHTLAGLRPAYIAKC